MTPRTLSVLLAAMLATGGERLAAQAPDVPRAFVEVLDVPPSLWWQQPCELRVQIGIDAEWFRTAAVPLFQQPLDQPFQVVVPWLLGAEDRAVALVPVPAGVPSQRLAVGDRVVAAATVGHRQVDGRRFDLFELRYRWLPLAAGSSTIAPVELRYAFATAFADDFLRGRQPLDRREHSVWSAVHSLPVRALPREGRPPEFLGAVGEFTVRAETTATSVSVGEAFDVELTIDGDGNLGRMAPLPPPRLPGFHVQGVREPRRSSGRTFVLSVVALRAGATSVPAIPFASFSPAAGAYVVPRSEPLPLQVVPLPAGVALPPAIAALVAADVEVQRAARAWPWWGHGLLGLLLLLVGGGAAASWRRVRRRRQGGAATARLEAALAEGALPTLAAFEQLCAQRAGARAFDGTTVWATLRAVGVAADAVAAAQVLHSNLDAARFGGVPPPAAEVRAAARPLA